MEFTFLDALSIPGNPAHPNDDAWGQTSAAAAVLDGATNLGDSLLPGDSDAAWIARFGARRLMAHCQDGLEPFAALRRSLAEAEKSFHGLRRRAPRENYEHPYASMMFVSGGETGVEAFWFGDCAALLRRPGERVEIVGEAFDKRAAEARRVSILAKAKGLAPASGHNRPEFLSALRLARNSVNTERGSWLFGPHAQAADHVRRQKVEAAPGTALLLVSDGFLALCSDYGLYTPDALMSAAEMHGLERLGRELRAAEESDPDGTRFPRFKKSDDATAVLMRVSA